MMGEFYQYSVIIQRQIEEHGFITNVDMWCNENIEGQWGRDPTISFNTQDWISNYHYEFDLESDAVLFKLKWS